MDSKDKFTQKKQPERYKILLMSLHLIPTKKKVS